MLCIDSSSIGMGRIVTSVCMLPNCIGFSPPHIICLMNRRIRVQEKPKAISIEQQVDHAKMLQSVP